MPHPCARELAKPDKQASSKHLMAPELKARSNSRGSNDNYTSFSISCENRISVGAHKPTKIPNISSSIPK